LSKPSGPGLTTLERRARHVAGIIDELKGENIVVLDLRGLSDFTDAFIIATVRSNTHMKGLTAQLLRRLRDVDLRPINKVDTSDARWALLDYVDLVVHLFEAEARAIYDLEQLWGDAEQIAWQQPLTA
jgi:ribosome-associated protein